MKKRDTMFSALIFVFAAVCFFYVIPAYTPSVEVRHDLGPEMFPKLTMAMLMICSLALVAINLFSGSSGKNDEGAGDEAAARESNLQLAAWCKSFIAVLFYILGVSFVGFYSSTFVFTAVYFRRLERKAYAAVLVTNLALFALIWFGFEKLMKVALPAGLLF
ncbi:tripartite tricarboxylate transporter TctB family protein [Synergistaceae bacterium OttesenSCG-928-I11]|nr:tripartite tricarboxylate transporter TctB family protein [Synergistaceae bacterium OttesenSCG-928-I11]